MTEMPELEADRARRQRVVRAACVVRAAGSTARLRTPRVTTLRMQRVLRGILRHFAACGETDCISGPRRTTRLLQRQSTTDAFAAAIDLIDVLVGVRERHEHRLELRGRQKHAALPHAAEERAEPRGVGAASRVA